MSFTHTHPGILSNIWNLICIPFTRASRALWWICEIQFWSMRCGAPQSSIVFRLGNLISRHLRSSAKARSSRSAAQGLPQSRRRKVSIDGGSIFTRHRSVDSWSAARSMSPFNGSRLLSARNKWRSSGFNKCASNSKAAWPKANTVETSNVRRILKLEKEIKSISISGISMSGRNASKSVNEISSKA